ncbi:helix-turn-helix domain-containing protein [Paenibacillus sp. FSL H7-0331]|uniref:helix-turn-helix domain-containing protein n=1 Tax=Paenibacillus sp. FSL H7-0331 TaxID=1920421 RepID=UPI0009FAE411|nr:helix-turn-helix domain-containing protein [Paenibacillus sp. FSL H7-0331]
MTGRKEMKLLTAIKNKWLRKVITVLLALLFLIIIASASIFYFVFTDNLKEELTRTNLELLKHLDQKLEIMLKNIDKESIQLVQYDEVKRFFDGSMTETERSVNELHISNHIDRLIRSDEFLFSVEMYSYPHNRLVTGDNLTESMKLKNYQWIAEFELFDGYSNWLPARKLPISGANDAIYRNVVTLVRTYPLIHPPGSRKGVVAFNIKEDMLFSLIKNNTSDDQSKTMIIDRDGVVVLHPDSAQLSQDLSGLPYIAQIRRSGLQEGVLAAEVGGKKSRIFYFHAPYTDWTFVRLVPEVQLNEPLMALRSTLVWLCGIILITALVIALVVGRWTFRPIYQFVQTVSSKLNTHPQVRSSAESSLSSLIDIEARFHDIMNGSEQLHKQMKENMPIMKWQLLIELLSDYKINFSNVKPYMEMLGIQLYPNRFIVMCAELDYKSEIASTKDLHLYNYALCNVADEFMNAEGRGASVELENGTCAMIISFADDGCQAELLAAAIAELIKKYVQDHFKQTITIGIGGCVQSVRDIHLSYKQAVEALSYKLVTGRNSIITLEDIQSDPTPQFYRLVGMTDGMLDSIKLLDTEKLSTQIDRWYETFTQYNVSPEMIRQLNLQLMMKTATVADEIGIAPDELIGSRRMQDTLNQLESLEDMKFFLIGVLSDYIERIKERRSTREKSDLIERVQQFIHMHYSRNDLSLNLLADEFKVSISHLSKMFKEQTESNFIDYLMEHRVNQAKALLEQTDSKIRHIAESVGYGNVNSFVRIFKKITALTPSEYRTVLETRIEEMHKK